jgi:putative ABC transport system permease protein
MQSIWQNLRYSTRILLKNPGFSVVAILTLALAIGANTAIFTIVKATLLRSLPYQQPERLYHLWELNPQKNFSQREASYPDYLDWKQNNSLTLASYTGGGGATLTGRGNPERINAGRVSANFFDVLGVQPLRGRFFLADEEKPGNGRVVVLSYGLWQRLFGGDEKLIGETLILNGINFTVTGILPPSFNFAPRGNVEMWMPMQPSQNQLTRRFMHWVNVIARLNDGATQEQAQSEMNAIAAHIVEQYPDSHTGTGIKLIPLSEQITGSVTPILYVLLGAVGFVLLIACANVANLLLVRSAARQKEVAIRLALGASRAQLIQQFLTESLLLAVIGGALGVFLAMWGVEVLIAIIPEAQLSMMPYLRGVTIDTGILGFTFALSLLTGVLFGLVPALQTSKPDLQSSLKEGGKSSTVAFRQRFRNALVISEIALAIVLLIGASLMLKSTLKLLAVNPGFNTENLLTFQTALLPAKYSDENKIVNMHKELLTRIESLPGVSDAATVGVIPLIGGNTTHVFAEGQPRPAPGEETEANLRDVSAGYFKTMEVPLIAGREFNDFDNLQSKPVIIINQTLSKIVFPNQPPIGQRLLTSGDDSPPLEIVGVVTDEKVTSLDSPQTPVMYYPFQQGPDMSLSLVVRSSSNPHQLINAIRTEAQTLDPDLSIFAVQTMEEVIESAPATFMRRYPALLIGVFAASALLLAMLGIYGVLSFMVTQRRQELGIRIALGAKTQDIIRLILNQGMRLILPGLIIGLLAALLLSRLLETLLYGVSATDTATFIGVSLLLAIVALIACYVPARRAAGTSPMIALRSE